MIQSLIRAMDILEILSKECRPYSLVEISHQSKLPASTVHRILQTFCADSYVLRDETTHLYKLGPALVALGSSASRHVDLRKAVMPELRALTRETGEDSYMVIKNGFKGVIVDKVEGPSQLKVVEHFGYEQDLSIGGLRKALLAFSSADFISQYSDYFLTCHTTAELEKLNSSINKIIRQRVAVTAGEYIKEGIGIGAPVFDSKGEVVASIGMIMPATRAHPEVLERLKKSVVTTAENISRNLGHAPI